ncbi:hypothetical protein [Methylosinus sp. Sm6]|uniref:hypothetical protein n=1 Tax=Methylosinus sp. Sm6 TaxID=2866948 RepID=UPI001C99D0C2|nr:hypothetical protein [Methylosinus sp. Sm6]MBY6243166.1 hypothetical protein [Methylosinus sp. Sm6]
MTAGILICPRFAGPHSATSGRRERPSDFADLYADTIALGLFTLVSMGLAFPRFRQTPD